MSCDDGSVAAVVATDEVRERRAVRVAARQGDEVGRADPPAGLLAEAPDRARGGRPVHRVDLVRAPGREHRLDRHAGDVVGGEGVVDDGADLVVVDALGDGHRERREDPLAGEPADRLGLHLAEVLAPVVEVGLELEPVELQVDLDPIAQPRQFGQELVVARDPDAIRVEDHARDVPLGRGRDDLGDLGMHRRLPAGQHQRVDPAALALDRGVERPEDVREPGVPVDPGAALGEARRAVQVAVLGDVDQQDAAVLGLEIAEPVHVAHRDRTGVAGACRA